MRPKVRSVPWGRRPELLVADRSRVWQASHHPLSEVKLLYHTQRTLSRQEGDLEGPMANLALLPAL